MLNLRKGKTKQSSKVDANHNIYSSDSQNKRVGKKVMNFGSTKLVTYAFAAFFISVTLSLLILQKSSDSEAATIPQNNVVFGRLEAESMTRPSGAFIINEGADPGQKAVVFTKNGTASGTINLTANSNTINITARGTYCKSSWPKMTVKVDNITIASNINIDSNQWKDFIFTKTLNSGSHKVQISYTNDVTTCTRDLYVDSFEVSGAGTSPTVSINASPTSVNSGGSSVLSWSSTNAVSCNASGGWTGTKPTSGTFTTGAISASTTYSIECSGTGGIKANASTTVNVNVVSPPSSSIYWGSWISGSTYGRTASGQGDAPWDTTTWDIFEANAGKKVSILHYGQPAMWDQAFAPNPANNITSRGAIPLMDMSSGSTSLASITAGTYDSSIITWAKDVKSWGKPFMFRWNWEMNGTWFNWGAQAQQNPASFVSAWKHIHDIVTAQGATNVTWVWCPNEVYPGSTPLNQLYPGDSYVDWTCIDGYNKGTSSGEPNVWRNFSSIFTPTYNEVIQIAPSKPIIVGETASNEGGGSKSAWVTDAITTQVPTNFPKIKAFVWFNWPILETGVNQQWPIESSPSTQAAFKQAISSPYYSSNNYGNLPLLTKVAPLN